MLTPGPVRDKPIADGRIAACGDYAEVRRSYPDAEVRDLSGGYLLPGFVDTHIHFPQVRILGGLGYSLLEWLDALTLPEEARLADPMYACSLVETTMAFTAGNFTVPPRRTGFRRGD